MQFIHIGACGCLQDAFNFGSDAAAATKSTPDFVVQANLGRIAQGVKYGKLPQETTAAVLLDHLTLPLHHRCIYTAQSIWQYCPYYQQPH